MFNLIKKIFRYLTKKSEDIKHTERLENIEILEAFKRIDEGIYDDVMFFINNENENKDKDEIETLEEELEKNVIIVPKHKPFIKITL